ncbi:MFS transporter [Mycobacterium sp. 236(2023)]|uniref:MFS transporter n=1 Tax=Mycobacterium sp. 236(2023) TaxID=3038163 RepID=UPI0024159467|nr:MFS transporter [Mycobacterium sp. 236(2023)]MDG4668039.1 MFS transporter [Mycobacterium sp. 236(2023)]
MRAQARSAPAGRAGDISRRQMWLVLVAVLVADALDLVDATITNVAAPTIMRDLGGGESLVQWLGAGYALALGSLMVVGGRIGDRFGQRQTFLIGMSGFIVASLVAGCAVNAPMLVVARVLQGAFGALLIPQGMAIMAATFPKDMLRRAFAVFAPALVVFGVAGPLLGGLLLEANVFGFGWRAVFLVNVVIGGAGLLFAWQVLPHVPANHDVRIDLMGCVLLMLAVFGVLGGLLSGADLGWTPPMLAGVGIGTICFAIFVLQQRTTAHPLLDPRLLGNRGFTAGLVAGLLIFASFSGMMYVLSLYFQLGLHFSPIQAALNLLPLTLGIAAGSMLCTALLGRIGRYVLGVGLGISSAGVTTMLVVITWYGDDTRWWQLGAATLLIGLGAGPCFNAIFNVALGDLAPSEAGAASGSLNAIQQVANGVGAVLVTSVFFAALARGPIDAMRVTLGVVLMVTLVSFGVIPLLPKQSRSSQNE